MAKTLTSKLELVLTHVFTNTIDLSAPKESFRLDLSDEMAAGTGDSQIDQSWHDQRTLTAASEELDLAGVLTNIWGDTITFAKVRTLAIHNKSTTSTEILTVGGAAVNAFVNWVGDATDKIKIGPDGILLLHCPIDGYAVVADTGDLLKIDAGADTIDYEIYIAGVKA